MQLYQEPSAEAPHRIPLRHLASPLLIIGAAHTGKSELATEALSPELPTTVLGTAVTNHADMKARIDELKSARPKAWTSVDAGIELSTALDKALAESEQILLDSLNQWVAASIVGRMGRYSLDQIEAQLEQDCSGLISKLSQIKDHRLVIVTSEVGAGIAPQKLADRIFRRATGRLNHAVAQLCTSVALVSCGLPFILKGGPAH